MMVPNTQKVNSLYDELMVSTQWSSNEKVCFETRSLTSDNSYTLSLPNESIQTYCSLFCEQQLGHSLSIIQLKNPNTPPHPVPPEKVLPNPSIEQDGRQVNCGDSKTQQSADSCFRERNFRVHRVAQEEFIRQKFQWYTLTCGVQVCKDETFLGIRYIYISFEEWKPRRMGDPALQGSTHSFCMFGSSLVF